MSLKNTGITNKMEGNNEGNNQPSDHIAEVCMHTLIKFRLLGEKINNWKIGYIEHITSKTTPLQINPCSLTLAWLLVYLTSG